MKAIVSVFLMVIFSILTGCSTTSIVSSPKEKELSTVDQYQVAGEAVARAANVVIPAINDINTCPPDMKRADHRAGGSAASTVRVTEKGTEYSVSASGSQSQKCVEKTGAKEKQ